MSSSISRLHVKANVAKKNLGMRIINHEITVWAITTYHHNDQSSSSSLLNHPCFSNSTSRHHDHIDQDQKKSLNGLITHETSVSQHYVSSQKSSPSSSLSFLLKCSYSSSSPWCSCNHLDYNAIIMQQKSLNGLIKREIKVWAITPYHHSTIQIIINIILIVNIPIILHINILIIIFISSISRS